MIKNCHSGLYISPAMCLDFGPIVQGNTESNEASHWLFESVKV